MHFIDYSRFRVAIEVNSSRSTILKIRDRLSAADIIGIVGFVAGVVDGVEVVVAVERGTLSVG